MSRREIIFKKDGSIVTIIFNRPEVHNALNAAMVDGLEESLDKIEKNRDIRVLA